MLLPSSSHLPWPSPVPAGLGSLLTPFGTGSSDAARFTCMLQPDNLLTLSSERSFDALLRRDFALRRHLATGRLGAYPG